MVDKKNIPLSDAEAAEFALLGWKITNAMDSVHGKRLAFNVIKEFASINKSIPAELVPFLNEACNHFIDIPDTKVSKAITASNWAGRILDVEVLRSCGDYTVFQACEAIANRDKGYSSDSLFSKHKGHHKSKNTELVYTFIESLLDDGYTPSGIVTFILNKQSNN